MERMEREAEVHIPESKNNGAMTKISRDDFLAGAQALWSALMERPPIEEAAQGAVIVVLDIQNANLRDALAYAKKLLLAPDEVIYSSRDVAAEIEKLERGGV